MSLHPLRSRSRRRRSRVKYLALIGALLGAAAALAKRAGAHRLIGLGGDSKAATHSSPASPGPSNYDVGGPPANTATHVPVPPPAVPAPIDEEAEVAAAAAEAAGIGGIGSAYASPDPGIPADEELRPLVEAGEGDSEGFEQAEAELVDAAEPSDTASPYEKQIDEAIELQDNPSAGESGEAPLDTGGRSVDFDQPGDDQGASAESTGSSHSHEESEPGDRSEREDRP